MKRKLFVVFLSIVLIVTMMPLSAFAETSKSKSSSNADYLCFTAVNKAVTISMQNVGSPADLELEYSKDGENWENFQAGKTFVILAKDKKVYFRGAKDGQDPPGAKETAFWHFIMRGNGTVKASGNVMSLVDKDCTSTTIAKDCAFTHLFDGCEKLVSAPNLPAKTLTEECYRGMFRGCSNLVTAPELPATNLAKGCYTSMFAGCESIKTAPKLPAKTLVANCYSNMFDGCTSLNSINVAFTDWNAGLESTLLWVKDVASKGTFTCYDALPTTLQNASRVPEGWTVSKPTPPRVLSMESKALDSKNCYITWNKVKGISGITYEIYRKTTKATKWSRIATVSGTSYTDKKVKAGTIYYYKVRAKRTYEGKTYRGKFSVPDFAYPKIKIISRFSVKALSTTKVKLSWLKSSDKNVQYWIYRKTGLKKKYGKVYAVVKNSKSTFIDKYPKVKPNKKYYYQIVPVVKGYDGKYRKGTATRLDYASTEMSTPRKFNSRAIGKHTVKCTWKKIPGAHVTYRIYRKTSMLKKWGKPIAITTKPYFIDRHLKRFQLYFYRVRAVQTINGHNYYSDYSMADFALPYK